MSTLKDTEKGTASGETSPVVIDQLAAFSMLLSAPFTAPSVELGERRSGQDRRVSDRRITAQEFSVPE